MPVGNDHVQDERLAVTRVGGHRGECFYRGAVVQLHAGVIDRYGLRREIAARQFRPGDSAGAGQEADGKARHFTVFRGNHGEVDGVGRDHATVGDEPLIDFVTVDDDVAGLDAHVVTGNADDAFDEKLAPVAHLG